ncbi:MAG: hypothetical protein IKR78_01040 [Dehalococcoidales bacterium]|jgi:uncharacterized membrane protein YkvA (DUF1232 family)|nr:hypothetical protein [Dehalococcoidales bacterium]
MSKDKEPFEGEVIDDEQDDNSAGSLIDTIKSVVMSIFHADTPIWVKAIAGVAIIYLLLPYDFLPGPLDDAVIVPLLFSVAWQLVPQPVREKTGADTYTFRSSLKKHKRRAIIIGIIAVLLYAALIGLIIWGSITIAKR